MRRKEEEEMTDSKITKVYGISPRRLQQTVGRTERAKEDLVSGPSARNAS